VREVGLKTTRQRKRDSLQAAYIHHAIPDTPQWLIGIGAALRGKATAVGEPANVTDEKTARDSTGRCGPVD
jgi:hypothetical protein